MVTMATASVLANPASPADVSTTSVPKKGSENRRSNKPIMEKRRRARINNSLNELKSLILDAMKKDPARHSKLEKADILEMTVKHLESLHKQHAAMSAVTDPQVVNKYRAGFSECAGEVGRFPGLEPAVRRRLLQHLATCLNTSPASSDRPQQNVQFQILPNETPSAQGIYLSAGPNSGVQLVPTRLANGDIALVLPTTTGMQRLSVSPAPSSSSSSPPPLTIINSRSASTDSTSSSSPINFDRLSVNIPTSSSSIDDVCHSPGSVQSSYSAPHSPNSGYYDSYQPYSPPSQKPLSLVVRESYMEQPEEKPWRPW